jgi:hypothetical protein
MHATYRKPLTLDRFNRALFPVHNCGTYELDAGKAFTVYDEDSESLVSTIFTATSSDSSTILQPAGEDISYHEICFGMVGADILACREACLLTVGADLRCQDTVSGQSTNI